MSLNDKLRADLKEAMKQKHKLKLDTIRLILKELKEAEIAQQKDLSEEQIIKVIEKIIKQAHESIADYSKVDNQAAISKEQECIQHLESYLPEAPSKEALIEILEAELANHDNPVIADLGKIVGSVRSKLPTRSDMKFVTEFLKNKLG